MRKVQSGFTLVEVIVSLFVFAILGTLVAVSVQTYGAAQVKGIVGTDIDRALSTTSGRLETLLRGCRVVSPAVGDTASVLEFQAPRVNEDGLLVVTATGQPEWSPSRQLLLQDHKLMISADEPVIVGNLGPSGEVSFERRDSQVLRVSLTAGFEAAESVGRKSANLHIVLSMAP